MLDFNLKVEGVSPADLKNERSDFRILLAETIKNFDKAGYKIPSLKETTTNFVIPTAGVHATT